MSAGETRVAVIGGGIVGASCAYYLHRSGYRVTLLDRGAFGQGCSHGNCGYVCPSHVLPLTEPGAPLHALKSLFQSNAPFYVRPRLDLRLAAWFLHFTRRCNARDMLSAADALHTLLTLSMREYREWMTSPSLACEWKDRGLLFVFSSKHEFDAYAKTNEMLSQRYGISAHRLDRDTLLQSEPALKESLAGAWKYETDSQLKPDILMAKLKVLLQDQGVDIREHCPFRTFESEASRARYALTDTQRIEADYFVLATGAWTQEFEHALQCRLPIQPGKGYSMSLEKPRQCPISPMIFHEHRVAGTSFDSAYRLGSTMEFSGFDATLNPRRLGILTSGAKHYLREMPTKKISTDWFGWRPMTWDGLPIIDWAPRIQNVLVAAGHNMLGLSLGPATGRLVSELIAGKPTTIDCKPFRLSRFQ